MGYSGALLDWSKSKSSGNVIKILGCSGTLLDWSKSKSSDNVIKILGCSGTLLDWCKSKSSDNVIKILGYSGTLPVDFFENCLYNNIKYLPTAIFARNKRRRC